MIEPVRIDEVKPSNGLSITGDTLELEWFEHKRYKLIRQTQAGQMLALRLTERQEWHHGDQLFVKGHLIATIVFKPCLAIEFKADSMASAADFCYFIGNRHLPIFSVDPYTFHVSYDGRLYEQLSVKYADKIRLIDALLLHKNSLRKQAILL